MVFTTFRTYEANINLQLPKASTGDNALKSMVVISINKEGNFYLSGQQVSEEQLLASVKTKLASNPNEVVIIRADESIPYSYIVRALDVVQAGGGYNISLAVEKH